MLQPGTRAVLYLWAGRWAQAVQGYVDAYVCLVPCSNPQLRAQFTPTLNTTDALVLSQALLVFFSAALANLWPRVFMHPDG